MESIDFEYKCPEGEEYTFTLEHPWLAGDVAAIAQEIAVQDRGQDDDLIDRDAWPRTYQVRFDGQWVAVCVDMEYEPAFHAVESQIIFENEQTTNQ